MGRVGGVVSHTTLVVSYRNPARVILSFPVETGTRRTNEYWKVAPAPFLLVSLAPWLKTVFAHAQTRICFSSHFPLSLRGFPAQGMDTNEFQTHSTECGRKETQTQETTYLQVFSL